MLLFYVLISFFISWIWVDYFRLINVYHKLKIGELILVFLIGCLSILFFEGLDYFCFSKLQLVLKNEFFNDLAYCILKIGLPEEISKILPFGIIYLIFRKKIRQPIDYIIYGCMAALSFAAIENVMYFSNNGPSIINTRAILCSLGHMIDTSFIIYGIIRFKFSNSKNGVMELIGYFSLAVLSHGFYDFWLIHESTSDFGGIISILYFMTIVSLFGGILNNALNNDGAFTYKKVIPSNKVFKQLMLYHVILLASQFCLMIDVEGFEKATYNLFGTLMVTGMIITICCLRLSRFKLIQHRWARLKMEIPFKISLNRESANGYFSIHVKGETNNEANVNQLYHENCYLSPVRQEKSYIQTTRLAYIEREIFFFNDDSCYVAKVFVNGKNNHPVYVLLKPKIEGKRVVNGKYPVVGIYRIDDMEKLKGFNLSIQQFQLVEWGFLRPLKTAQKSTI